MKAIDFVQTSLWRARLFRIADVETRSVTHRDREITYVPRRTDDLFTALMPQAWKTPLIASDAHEREVAAILRRAVYDEEWCAKAEAASDLGGYDAVLALATADGTIAGFAVP